MLSWLERLDLSENKLTGIARPLYIVYNVSPTVVLHVVISFRVFSLNRLANGGSTVNQKNGV